MKSLTVPTATTLALILAIPALSAAQEAPPSIPAPEDVAAPPSDAEVTESGLASKVLAAGDGDLSPEADDIVVVHYTGWTADGEMFDSSVARGAAVRLALNTVIEGWTEGLQLMREGETRRLWIPEELAYGGREDRPQGMLVFDVELLEVVRPPVAPSDVAGPPAEAEELRKGLHSVVLEPGTGSEKPNRRSRVVVHYTGWTTDGEMFDTTVLRGQPASFDLNQVIPGWTYGLQEMVEGEKRRLWISEGLAYRGKKGMPEGMLVFDVERVAIR